MNKTCNIFINYVIDYRYKELYRKKKKFGKIETKTKIKFKIIAQSVRYIPFQTYSHQSKQRIRTHLHPYTDHKSCSSTLQLVVIYL